MHDTEDSVTLFANFAVALAALSAIATQAGASHCDGPAQAYMFIDNGPETNVEIHIAGNLGEVPLLFLSGTKIEWFAATINVVSQATGVEATVIQPGWIELSSTAVGSRAFVSVEQLKGMQPLVCAELSLNACGLYSHLDFGVDGLVADVNCDWIVDARDMIAVIAGWGECRAKQDCPPDVDQNGVVNVDDLLLVISNWGH